MNEKNHFIWPLFTFYAFMIIMDYVHKHIFAIENTKYEFNIHFKFLFRKLNKFYPNAKSAAKKKVIKSFYSGRSLMYIPLHIVLFRVQTFQNWWLRNRKAVG